MLGVGCCLSYRSVFKSSIFLSLTVQKVFTSVPILLQGEMLCVEVGEGGFRPLRSAMCPESPVRGAGSNLVDEPGYLMCYCRSSVCNIQFNVAIKTNLTKYNLPTVNLESKLHWQRESQE